jgi:uncharacterized repeat protein (TIGR03806 family)
MKKFLILICFAYLIVSCTDDDTLVVQCDIVTNIASNSITENSALIVWETTNHSASYTLEYGVSGFALGSGISVTEANTSTNLINLQVNTTYDVYIQTVCSSNNTSIYTDAYSFTTLPPTVVAELRPNLSELNLYLGNLNELTISSRAFEYDLSTPLFTDYSKKQRLIALPVNTSMQFNGDGLPIFPDNTVIAKTFYYNLNERDLSEGRQIIETRILIKKDGDWITGDYKWNEDQTDAVLHLEGSTLPISWIDADGNTKSTTYRIPSDTACFTCHQSFDDTVPIGPKLRTMNFDFNGTNQLQQLINDGQLTGLTDVSSVNTLPNWQDTTASLEERARAYFDVNCAHCHTSGGQCEDQSSLNLAYETLLENTDIVERKLSIQFRISEYNEGVSMPFIGTTLLHTEGVDLIQDYLDTL